jgi:p-cumate 2,3-dioxygenase beta subunit
MSDATLAPGRALTASREMVKEFLYTEARLLDRWLLKEWLTLFASDARYQIAPAGVEDDVDPATTLFYVNDDNLLLSERVARLYSRNAHAEFPHSKCRRMVSNVQILGGNDANFEVAANFLAFRTKFGKTEMFPGHYLYELSFGAGRTMIRKKTVFLDVANLYEQSKVSIIL